MPNQHKPVKMIIFRDTYGDVAMCADINFHAFIREDDIPVIEKVFEATTWNEAGQVFNDHCDYGIYNSISPDIYLDDKEVVIDDRTRVE